MAAAVIAMAVKCHCFCERHRHDIDYYRAVALPSRDSALPLRTLSSLSRGFSCCCVVPPVMLVDDAALGEEEKYDNETAIGVVWFDAHAVGAPMSMTMLVDFVVAETEERELNAFDPETSFIDEWYYIISLCLLSQLLSYEFVFTTELSCYECRHMAA